MTEHDQPQSATKSPFQQMVQLQFAWQQLFWRLPLSLFSATWLAGRPTPVAVEAGPPADEHGQLSLPPVIAAEGEHSLFA